MSGSLTQVLSDLRFLCTSCTFIIRAVGCLEVLGSQGLHSHWVPIFFRVPFILQNVADTSQLLSAPFLSPSLSVCAAFIPLLSS